MTAPEYDGTIEPGPLKEVPRTLAERVAALEELIAYPPVTIEAPAGWTDEQAEKFRAEFEAQSGRPARGNEFRLLPPAPVLTPETARALLRECVTVVRPGETLVIRAPGSWTPQQAEQYQQYADAATDCGRIAFPVLVVIGEELGVVKPFNDHAAEALAAATPEAGAVASPS